MKPDPPIDEIRKIRHEISAEYNHDPSRIVEFYREFQERHKDRMISPGSQPPKTKDDNAA